MIQGSCHCGSVRWTFEGLPDGATAFNCTVCRSSAALILVQTFHLVLSCGI